VSFGQRLRDLIAGRELLHVPEALSPLMARAVKSGGFEAVYFGAGAAANLYGAKPDLGLMSPMEHLEIVRAIVESVDLPLIADIDHGGETVLAIRHAIARFEGAGVAGVHIEDTVGNKKVYGMQVLLPAEAFRANLESAVDARQHDMVVIARSDIWMSGGGLDEAIARGEVAAAAGADLYWAPFTPVRLRPELAAAVPIPLFEFNPGPDDDCRNVRVVAHMGVLARRIAEMSNEYVATLRRQGRCPITDSSRAALSELIDEESYVTLIPGAERMIDGRDVFA
jgi:2-methylisocitrate lyase-like PEP mutase family enzyme